MLVLRCVREMEQEAELALGEVAVNELVRDLDLLAQALDADAVPGDDRVFVCEPGREMVAALDSLGNLILHEVVPEPTPILQALEQELERHGIEYPPPEGFVANYEDQLFWSGCWGSLRTIKDTNDP